MDAGETSTDASETSTDASDTETSDTETDPYGEWDPDATPPTSCEGVGVSLLPGVCIWFPADGHSWTLAEAAQGIEIPYWVIVEDDISNFVPQPQDAGWCDEPIDNGLIMFEVLTGNDYGYCICDSGNCGWGEARPTVTIPAGQTREVFHWNGLSWGGYSDTSEPYGPAFPAGTFTLEVSTIGSIDVTYYDVRNTFEVMLTED